MGGQLWWAKCLSGNPPNFAFLLCTCSSVFAIWKINSLSISLVSTTRKAQLGCLSRGSRDPVVTPLSVRQNTSSVESSYCAVNGAWVCWYARRAVAPIGQSRWRRGPPRHCMGCWCYCPPATSSAVPLLAGSSIHSCADLRPLLKFRELVAARSRYAHNPGSESARCPRWQMESAFNAPTAALTDHVTEWREVVARTVTTWQCEEAVLCT